MARTGDTSNPGTRQGIAAWLIPPADGWQLKSGGLTGSRLFLPLLAIAAVLLSLGGLAFAMLLAPERAVVWFQAHLLLLLAGAVLIGLILYRIQHHLLEPLTHLRHWALRMRGGNLAARIPVPRHGEFAELAKDINSLSEELQVLSREMGRRVAEQTERLAQKTRTLEILYDVAASINASHNLDDLLTRFLRTLKEVTNARAATVRLLTENNQMRLVASIGLPEEVVKKEQLVPVQRCFCGTAITEGLLLCQDHVRSCEEFVGRSVFDDVPDGDVELIAVPLQYQDKTLGMYNLFVAKPGLVARDDVKDLLTSIGKHLGMAVEKTRLDNEARRLTIIEERNMLAHELHDSLAQTLASLRFQVKMLEETLQDGPDEARRETRQIREVLEEAHTELRELLAHFRAPMDERGLIPALENTVAGFRKSTGISVFLQNEWGTPNLPANLELQVLRIVQEALSNIRKHSKARAVRILLRRVESNEYWMLVEDDGVGFEEPQSGGHPGEHVGLNIMKERARRLGGELRIESEPGEGTRILLNFRYPDGRHSHAGPGSPLT